MKCTLIFFSLVITQVWAAPVELEQSLDTLSRLEKSLKDDEAEIVKLDEIKLSETSNLGKIENFLSKNKSTNLSEKQLYSSYMKLENLFLSSDFSNPTRFKLTEDEIKQVMPKYLEVSKKIKDLYGKYLPKFKELRSRMNVIRKHEYTASEFAEYLKGLNLPNDCKITVDKVSADSVAFTFKSEDKIVKHVLKFEKLSEADIARSDSTYISPNAVAKYGVPDNVYAAVPDRYNPNFGLAPVQVRFVEPYKEGKGQLVRFNIFHDENGRVEEFTINQKNYISEIKKFFGGKKIADEIKCSRKDSKSEVKPLEESEKPQVDNSSRSSTKEIIRENASPPVPARGARQL